MSADPGTVLVVDDDEAVRRGLSRLIRSAGHDVRAFPRGQDVLAEPLPPGTGCFVLDVRLPDMTGSQLHDRLRERGVTVPVIFLTGYGDVTTGVRAMKNGAVDFLLKPVDGAVLLRTIDDAMRRHAAAQAREHNRSRIEARLARLSPREQEVLAYVIGGALNKQIAAQLGIAEKTVKVHRHMIMAKMQFHSVAELVRACETVGVPPRHPHTVQAASA